MHVFSSLVLGKDYAAFISASEFYDPEERGKRHIKYNGLCEMSVSLPRLT